ncbi:exopolysaccharide biosynthesis protein [Halomonas sp. CUBES01]|uniref:Exopolysaccharide biosynthesis protein n=1 Tax=Vreelandella gomseomensis TaxID=370766 RepID=A0ABU1GFF0_9GAMM|nr:MULTISPECIES: exopolysaccharide biosynthesis protein [Halomonas]MDR5876206.1 exopolysaccharide biosynthesis protein [Halomonas gomseomensis]MEC4768516.1 exopolysaccharide biosynthesis protein [Halomonas sp. CUBES01]
MDDSNKGSTLMDLIASLERMEQEAQRVSVDDVVHAIGRRSFGPLLLVAGLITLAPIIGDIPGMPTLMAALVLLVSVQLLAGRETFWLPGWMLKRSISRNKFDKGIYYLKKPARWVDGLLRVRLPWLTGYIGIRVTAVVCLLIALAMPPMEFIPFSANGAGLALALLGLGLVARDGLVLLLGFALLGATCALILVNVL